MKQFIIFIKKEFIHVIRDKKTLLVLFGMPIAQILIFGFALSGEINNAKIIVWNQSKDNVSQQLMAKIEASRYFQIADHIHAPQQIDEAFKKGEARIALVIPNHFNSDLQKDGTKLQIITDASDPNYATTLRNYLSAIIHDFQTDLNNKQLIPFTINPQIKMLYNPQLKKEPNLVPGVIALVLMLVCVMMTAVSIVKEKETGTMEILLVSPFKPVLVIISKAIPYLILSLINIATILLLSVYVLDVPIKGSLFLLFAEGTLFIITCLALGILISVRVKSQQVALLVSLIGMLLPTILFSGFLFPIANMPKILQIISNVVPAKWFYIIAKTIMIKGLGLAAVWKETLILLGMTLFLFFVSLKNFKTRLS